MGYSFKNYKQTCEESVARSGEHGYAEIIKIVDVSIIVADEKADKNYGCFDIHFIRESRVEVVSL